jgi:predicted transcriptional regulator
MDCVQDYECLMRNHILNFLETRAIGSRWIPTKSICANLKVRKSQINPILYKLASEGVIETKKLDDQVCWHFCSRYLCFHPSPANHLIPKILAYLSGVFAHCGLTVPEIAEGIQQTKEELLPVLYDLFHSGLIFSKTIEQSGRLETIWGAKDHCVIPDYICHLCRFNCCSDVSFFNHLDSQAHKEKRCVPDSKPYACGICNKRFSQPGEMQVHFHSCASRWSVK